MPSWSVTPPQDPGAIDTLMKAYFDSDADIRTVMQTLFNSDFFKTARFAARQVPGRVRRGSPQTIGRSSVRRAGPDPPARRDAVDGADAYGPADGRGLAHGKEWIDGGTLTERVNFAVDQMQDMSKPGLRLIIGRLREPGTPISPEDFLDRCLELAGHLEVNPDVRQTLLEFAERGDDLTFETEAECQQSESRD